MKIIQFICLLGSILYASHAPAEISMQGPVDNIARGEIGVSRASSPLSFSNNPANSSARLWGTANTIEMAGVQSELLPGFAGGGWVIFLF